MDGLEDEDSFDFEENDELTTPAEVNQKLEEVWRNEKLAPDLLSYEEEIVNCMMDQIQHMESSLQRISKDDFRIVFHKLELDRIKYVLSDYIRTRLNKIEKFGAHILHLESQSNGPSLMSDKEKEFALTLTNSIKNYFHDVALKNMPPNMQALKLEEIGCKPQMNRSVFIKVIKRCRGVPIESYSDYGEEEIIDLNVKSQHVLRYQPVASLLKDGSIQLI